jgi:hypothetical protein
VGQSPFSPDIAAVFTVAAEIRKGPHWGPLNKINGTEQKKRKRENYEKVTSDEPFHHDYGSQNSFSEKRLKYTTFLDLVLLLVFISTDYLSN